MVEGRDIKKQSQITMDYGGVTKPYQMNTDRSSLWQWNEDYNK
jgi:hypothetical protein